jgi:hypothetical protein
MLDTKKRTPVLLSKIRKVSKRTIVHKNRTLSLDL